MSVRIRRRRGPNINSRWCPMCGARNDYHAKFCRVCATPLGVKGTFDDEGGIKNARDSPKDS